jgi:hypothetical protein
MKQENAVLLEVSTSAQVPCQDVCRAAHAMSHGAQSADKILGMPSRWRAWHRVILVAGEHGTV